MALPTNGPPFFGVPAMRRAATASLLLLLAVAPLPAADPSRIVGRDGSDPYYVGRTYPKLVTPQWFGEPGVEAVVILAIDDMREPKKYEAFLRPILRRLKQITGRAPVSIMCNKLDPKDPLLQEFLKEGLSLEVHTLAHPCPLLAKGDFAKAKATYDGCVDLLDSVPGNHAVAFRMPCCDSLNTPSPRFWAEMFNKTTAKGNFLEADSSVFNVITSNDPELPRELVLDADGRDKFRKYVPYDRGFVNTIEDYPYPYVIGRLCWEFPCVTPSDWQASHLHKSNNPVTVRDWKAALDATVIKRGVFTMVFHPHGWIRNDQIVDLIDYAVNKYGKRVKFLTFREALERLNKNLLDGHPLRDPKTGAGTGVALEDFNGDGYRGVFIPGKNKRGQIRQWATGGTWLVRELLSFVESGPLKDYPVQRYLWLRDRDVCLAANEKEQVVFLSSGEKRSWVKAPFSLRPGDSPGPVFLPVTWVKAPFSLPPGAHLSDKERDHGLRFVDLDEDGNLDVVFSNEKEYGIYLFTDLKNGWSRKVMAGKAGEPGALPMISRNGTNNGFFVHSRSLCWVNENTDLLPNHVDRRSFNDLLMNVEPTARSPKASWRSIQCRPGFEVELVAAEPLVQDPIAVAWGPDGKLWVVEMGDYPLGVDGKGSPGGRIKYLESTKGDGKYDKATLFLDGLHFPTAIIPWRKGVIVSAAPDIFYAEDTDGDGKADKIVPLYTGFQPGNPQHRVNGLVWGLDNWLYLANGDSGGRIRSVKTGKTIDIRGRDLRIRPDDGGLEAETGQTQFGRCRDDWGNWFGCNNSNPMYQYVLSDHYLRRNPHVPPPELRVSVSETPGAARVFPISRTLPRFNDPGAANHFTSACSVIVYRDDLFGPLFAGNSFVSEPVHNLVHREVLTPTGATFTSRRALDETESEFWASSDNWARPTTIQTGPDGALWVVDMYRAVIEHPEWIPPDWQKRLDLRAGSDMGRIYRVYPVGKKPRAIPRLDRLDTAGLVAALDSANGWQRDTAQQMLIWRNDQAAVPLLEKQAAESKRPLCRLHSLCTLDGLGVLPPEVLARALDDPHPGVRRHAVRLCEGRLRGVDSLGENLVLRVTTEDDPHVRLQLACTLGEWDDPRAGQGLAELALTYPNDRYLLAAVLSSVNRRNLAPMLVAVLRGKHRAVGEQPPAALVENLLRLATALGDRGATVSLLEAVAAPENGRHAAWQFAALAGLLDALAQRGTPLARLAEGDARLKTAVGRLDGLFAAARSLAGDDKAPLAERVAAVRLLGRGPDHRAEDVKELTNLLVPQNGEELQSAAVAALGGLHEAGVPEVLLRGWKGYSPPVRGRVLDALLGREDWSGALLDAVEHKQVLIQEIDAVHRQRLLQHRAAAIRSRAGKVLAGALDPDRAKVVAAYRPALALAGDASRGRQLFTKTCATCHQLAGIGNQVGPDLASVGDKSPEGLLISILDPNRAVEARYLNYQAVLRDGRTFSGLLAGETGNSITLIGPDGKKQVVLRTELDELTGTGKSLMPEGLEKDLKPQDLADLIAFVRSASPALRPKVFEGNHPEVVHASADGSLRLLAANAEIYGSTLVLEKQYGNLGYWSSVDDQAAWAVEVPRAGRYAVWFDYACDGGAAGNAYELRAGDSHLTGRVAGTGSWDVYKQVRVGAVTLAAGRQQVVLRGVGKIKGALIDLKGIRMVPVGSE
jgi:putative membrane-bound dehydrogenase-like protein